MGEKGSLSLVNGSTALWQQTAKDSKKLKKWDFPTTIEAGQQIVEIETDDGLHVPSDASGSVTYQLQDTSCSFQIQLRVVDSAIVLQVLWEQSPNQFVVFPPASASGGEVEIGWSSGGTVSLGVFTLVGDPLPLVPAGDTAWMADWMALYGRCMAALTLRTLTIPGTHDSGTYAIPLPNLFTKTQDLDFSGQLSAGVRYFDMRVGYQPQYDDDNRFILVHEWVKSNATLADAFGQITAFLSVHPAEILILDFHRFTNFATDPITYDGPDFPYAELSYRVAKGLGPWQFNIPAGIDATAVTLNDVYATTGRVLVSFNANSDYYESPAYIPPITQEWQGSSEDANTVAGVKALITCVLDGQDCPNNDPKPIPTGIWAMMAAINYPPFVWPKSLAPDIDNWFAGGSDWSVKCNVIATDFIEQSALASNSICTSVYKGTMG